MLVIDTSLLSEYLDGEPAARDFLAQRADEPWAVPSLVLYEASMGAVDGYIGGTPAEVQSSVRSAMSVLDVTAATAAEASELQEDLMARGTPGETIDVLAAAAAREHGGRFATADRFFWQEEVGEVLEVDPYRPGRGDEAR